jgi:hypothetical protein
VGGSGVGHPPSLPAPPPSLTVRAFPKANTHNYLKSKKIKSKNDAEKSKNKVEKSKNKVKKSGNKVKK